MKVLSLVSWRSLASDWNRKCAEGATSRDAGHVVNHTKNTLCCLYSNCWWKVWFSFPLFPCPLVRRALKKKTKPLNLKIHSSVGSCENLPTQRSPLHTERSLRSFFFPSFIPSTPPVHAETPSGSKERIPQNKPRFKICLLRRVRPLKKLHALKMSLPASTRTAKNTLAKNTVAKSNRAVQ